jgi:hypothetical protein
MKLPHFLAPLIAGLVLLSGCASPSHSDVSADEKTKPYTDPASGVVLPENVASLERVSMNTDDSDKKNPVSAHYTATSPMIDTAASPMIDAAIRINPTSDTTPDQLLGETIRSLQNNPGFAQTEYRGLKTFGNHPAECTECSFDRPASGDRVTLKIVLFPRGNFLICFTFMVQSAQAEATQGTIDSFIREIITKSTKEVLMAPEEGGSHGQL